MVRLQTINLTRSYCFSKHRCVPYLRNSTRVSYGRLPYLPSLAGVAASLGLTSACAPPTVAAAVCTRMQCSQRSGAPAGLDGETARALDRTGRQNAVHTRPGSLRTAVIVEDGGPCKVRNFSVGGCRGLQGTAGDYGGL